MNISQFIPDELRKKFSEIIKENSLPQNSNMEIEARFGYFVGDIFNSKLIDNSLYLNTKKHLDALCNKHLASISRIETHKIIDINNLKIRRIQELPGRTYYQKKVSDWNYDNKDWGIRFCRSYETEINETKIVNFISTFRRNINRITYIDNRFNSQFFGFKIEISKVYSNGECNHEMELEALPGAILTIDKWWGALKTLYGWSLDAKNNNEIISLKERLIISNNLNKLLTNNSTDIILPSIVNRPKILDDLINMKNKAISIKVDGLHKILYFCKTGTYSCSPCLNIVKINDIQTEIPTIIESEYILDKFVGFDIMIYKNKDVRNIYFKERYKLLSEFIDQFGSKMIVTKDWYFPGNELNIYELINSNEIPIDGLIFQSMGFYKDDIYKWKPPQNLTLDFHLQLGINGTCEVYIFKSQRLHKINIKISQNTNLEDLHNKIVECRYIPDKEYWEPLKIRDDKLRPNSYQVLQNTIKLLKNPITLDNIINALK